MGAIQILLMVLLCGEATGNIAQATSPTHEANAPPAAHAEVRHDPHSAHRESSRSTEAHGETHESHDHEHVAHEGTVRLTPLQGQAIGLRIEPLKRRPLTREIHAPGEVRLNAYATANVSSRIPAQVLERHARLGDHVTKGEPLVTLSSVQMAEAQGNLLVARAEWERVRKLGSSTVSGRRYIEARIADQQARARVRAYGMSSEEIEQLVRRGDTHLADGSFRLLAPMTGTIIADDFLQGEQIDPGRLLFQITDESTVWVEARLTPEEASRVQIGDPARIRYSGRQIEGRVIQTSHRLDRTTRTQAVRIEVSNEEHFLHPGVFAEVAIAHGSTDQVLAVPEDAVIKSPDGDWIIFTEISPGEYQPVEVTVIGSAAGQTVLEGIDPGTPVVTRGTFFLQSELAKGGFEVHHH